MTAIVVDFYGWRLAQADAARGDAPYRGEDFAILFARKLAERQARIRESACIEGWGDEI